MKLNKKIFFFIFFYFLLSDQIKDKLSDYNIYLGNPHDLITNKEFIPYELITPLFSDYAYKHRSIYIPENKKIQYHAKEAFQFPVGTIIAKTFYYPKNFNDLRHKMINQYDNCNYHKIMEILNSHPELAIEKILTKESKEEQSSAKLNECSDEEFKEFKMLNLEYKKKFGFPFIIAVSGLNKNQILKNFRERIKKNNEQEFKEAKFQVKNIGNLRLNQILEKY